MPTSSTPRPSLTFSHHPLPMTPPPPCLPLRQLARASHKYYNALDSPNPKPSKVTISSTKTSRTTGLTNLRSDTSSASTKGLHKGYWLASRGRHATLHECARAHGYCHPISWPSLSQSHHMLGNTMSLCIVEQLLVHLLRAAYPLSPLADPGTTGTATQQLKDIAAAEALPSSFAADCFPFCSCPPWTPRTPLTPQL